ncbi:tyrosine-type recombinase/integrase [Candidatus Enterococcus murrayae]|uniref:Site-specific integrase n=1 Tax=Candidatus Enterococcus murrayae TaxID=2815321 RepID=A0ABS3HIA1_9ENTE|nr:site-specific integrase [Enterococcus sp. MJM16]MBO0453193.1 site-specific integrase [Enterococcus sp. MJM16]
MDKRSGRENIYFRKDGRWEGRYALGRRNDGRLKYGYVYGKSYQEVQTKLRPLKQSAQNRFQLYGRSLMLYEEWIKKWKIVVQGTVKTSTFSDYCYKLNRYLLPNLGELPLYQITSERIQGVIDEQLTETLSPNSIHIIVRLLSKTLKMAQAEGMLDKNPCEKVTLPKRLPQKIHALNVEQQRSLVEAVSSYPDEKGQSAILALNTGLRIGEIAALTWENIDFDKDIIHVDQTCHRVTLEEERKTCLHYDTVKSYASQRMIPMNRAVKKLLKNLKLKSKSQFVFSVGTKGCEPRVLTYHFHRVRQLANLEQIHFHQLRHTFATRCLEAKIGIASVSALLGHSSTKMTLDVYSDSMLEERIHAVFAIEQVTV